MRVIDQLTVQRRRGTQSPATIELLEGDLSALPPEHTVDALVVSAFPDSYAPEPGTLFEDLHRRGLDMGEVALHKEEDQRARLGCWISRTLPPEIAHTFNFTRIVCFEPRYAAFVEGSGLDSRNIEDTVGYVFRCLNNFVIPEAIEGRDARRFDIRRVAMPLLATGNQRVPLEAMLPRLLEAAVFWLEEGLPIECLKIVAFSPGDVDVATRVFAAKAFARPSRPTASPATGAEASAAWELDLARTIAAQVIEACTHRLRDQFLALASDEERPVVQRVFDRLAAVPPEHPQSEQIAAGTPPAASPEYDVFISYAHEQEQEVLTLVRELERQSPGLRVFYDRRSIPAGGQWLKLISNAVHRARTFVAVLSPDYSASPVCWDEFQCAKLTEYNTGRSVIRTVRLYSDGALPPIMGIHSYVDCAEGDVDKLRGAASALVAVTS